MRKFTLQVIVALVLMYAALLLIVGPNGGLRGGTWFYGLLLLMAGIAIVVRGCRALDQQTTSQPSDDTNWRQ